LFWGCVFSGILVGGIVALVSFLFLWQGSIYFVQRFVAIAIGVAIVALIRIAVMCAGRKKLFQSFYRKKPAAANIYFLAMEWANFSVRLKDWTTRGEGCFSLSNHSHHPHPLIPNLLRSWPPVLSLSV
jgi:hypothetical protein